MRRKRAIAILGVLLGAGAAAIPARQASPVPAVPVITEPSVDNQVINAFDVHMVAGPFAGAPGETHVCSDWEIRTAADVVVWSASCVTGTLAVHIHLGDGQFQNGLAGRHDLDTGQHYKLRVRFKGSLPAPDGSWSDWALRLFQTAPATAIEPIVISDVSVVPAPTWRDEAGRDVILPAASPQPSLRLEVPAVGPLLEFTGGDGITNDSSNPPALAAHGPLHVVCSAGGTASLSIPASEVDFTDGSGTDRAVFLPQISLSAGQSASFWISEGGGAFADTAPSSTTPDFSTPVDEPPVPWAIRQPGFRVERFATGLQLPVDIAFLPSPASEPDAPYFHVTELYGNVQVVTRSGAVTPYAQGLLNFDPNGVFPGSGETGVTGIATDPQSGDLFVALVYAVPGVVDYHFPMVIRLHSADGGRTASNASIVFQFSDEPSGASHQISNVSFGPDGKLYVHVGDGELTSPAEDLGSIRGKILRLNLDGSAPADNPFYAPAGPPKTNLIFAYGFRNPFGGAWRAADGMHWEVENGPSIDRIARVQAGRNYLWDGTDASMRNFAAYNWPEAHAPVNLAFVQPATFSGSGFPAEKMDHAFVTESGATYAAGPQSNGKRISEFAFDAGGNLVSGPAALVEYVGAGRGTAVGLTAGPDGLYFTDLYKNFGAATPIERGASVFRVRYIGIADFAADATTGPAPLTVAFTDASSVPSPTAWHWQFGDGTASDERAPSHTYPSPGIYDVRLTVTGAAGEASRQKAGWVVVGPGPPSRMTACPSESGRACLSPRPTPLALSPRD